MLAPLSPFEAYRTDLDRLNLRSEIGSSDTVWLLLAHCLGRLSRVGDSVREQLAEQSSEALRDLMESSDEAVMSEHQSDFRELMSGLSAIYTAQGADAVARSVRGFASRMVHAGALNVAYSVLANARVALVQSSDRERGLLMGDQAMVARLLGELDAADELYRSAALVGERASNDELVARSMLGRGVVARLRGNYPRARALLRQGLTLSEKHGFRDFQYAGHAALTTVHGIAREFDDGIFHGWRAFELAGDDKSRQIESLGNLALLCLDAGHSGAALRAFIGALARSQALRIRIPALGGAAIAAGRQRDLRRLQMLRAEIDRSVQRSALPYENAVALQSLAIAFLALGDEVTAERYRLQTLSASDTYGFHEIALKSTREEIAHAAKCFPAREFAGRAKELVVSLEQFEPEADEAAFALAR